MHIPPPLIVAATAGLMYAIDRIPLPSVLRFTTPVWLYTVIGIAGGIIAVAGVIEFRRHRTTVNPIKLDAASSLVTGGIFRWTRNPMYLGMLLFLFAIGLKFGNLVSLATAFLFVPIINVLQIAPEESVMLRLFGDAYQDYRQSTRRWL